MCQEIFDSLLELVEARHQAIHLLNYIDTWNSLRKLVDNTLDNLQTIAIASQQEALSKKLVLERIIGGWRSSSLKLLMVDPCLATPSFLNELKCMQRSLFIVQGILGVKRVKIGVFHQKGLTNQHSLV